MSPQSNISNAPQRISRYPQFPVDLQIGEQGLWWMAGKQIISAKGGVGHEV